jgi:hypothetical protein
MRQKKPRRGGRGIGVQGAVAATRWLDHSGGSLTGVPCKNEQNNGALLLSSSADGLSREQSVSTRSRANLLTALIVAGLLLAFAHYYGIIQWGGGGWG